MRDLQPVPDTSATTTSLTHTHLYQTVQLCSSQKDPALLDIFAGALEATPERARRSMETPNRTPVPMIQIDVIDDAGNKTPARTDDLVAVDEVC
jgi:hypothetical protein